MKIRTQQYLGACVSIAMVLAMGATLFIASRQVTAALHRGKFAEDIINAVSGKRYLALEYILHRHDRPRTQWLQRHESLSILLANDIYKDFAEREIMKRLRQRHRDAGDVFSRLMANHESRGAGQTELAMTGELDARLVSQLLEASEGAIADAFRLERTSHAQLEVAQRRAGISLMLAIAVMGFLVAANTVLTLRNILNPIARLRRGAEIIGQGDLDFRTAIVSANEIGDLSRAFDSMAARLQESRAGLEEKSGQLVEANRELESFSYSVSHDLRAPLRAIDGFSQRLVEAYRDKLDSPAVHYLDRIRAGTQAMAQLIDDLLNLSWFSRNKLNSFVRKPIEFFEFQKVVTKVGVYWLLMNQPPILE
jgi:nitrogen fixation/metabolism regulation signal transduction histidine kinase